jgi:hypothetical protein
MKIKKTITGKYSVTMSYRLRWDVWELMVKFLEAELAKLTFTRVENELHRHLMVNIVRELMIEKSFHLQSVWETRIILKRSQALALVWLLRESEILEVIDLKSELHKLLC